MKKWLFPLASIAVVVAGGWGAGEKDKPEAATAAGWVKYAKNPVLAHMFLNYMLDSKIAFSKGLMSQISSIPAWLFSCLSNTARGECRADFSLFSTGPSLLLTRETPVDLPPGGPESFPLL